MLKFDSILPWHEQEWQQLYKRKLDQILPHALLLTGPSGVGKYIFACNWAKLVLCQNEQLKSAQKFSCQSCLSCQWFNQGYHPDFYALGLSNEPIVLPAVLQVINALQHSSNQNGYRIIIINHAENLNQSAINALLKAVEEPFAKTQFLFITAQPNLIKPTLLSRCQIIKFFPVAPTPEIVEWLHQYTSAKSPTNLDSLQQQLISTYGAPLQVLDNHPSLFCASTLANLENLLQLRVDPLIIASQWAKQDLRLLLNRLIYLMMVLIKIKLNSATSCNRALFSNSLQQKITRFYPSLLLHFLKQLLVRKQHLMLSNPNPELMMESLCCHWYVAANSIVNSID